MVADSPTDGIDHPNQNGRRGVSIEYELLSRVDGSARFGFGTPLGYSRASGRLITVFYRRRPGPGVCIGTDRSQAGGRECHKGDLRSYCEAVGIASWDRFQGTWCNYQIFAHTIPLADSPPTYTDSTGRSTPFPFAGGFTKDDPFSSPRHCRRVDQRILTCSDERISFHERSSLCSRSRPGVFRGANFEPH